MTDDDTIRREGMVQYGFGTEAMKKTVVCSKCGAANRSDARYCTVCGAVLTRKNLFQEYKERHRCCPCCDTVLEEEADYCPHCGKKL